MILLSSNYNDECAYHLRDTAFSSQTGSLNPDELTCGFGDHAGSNFIPSVITCTLHITLNGFQDAITTTDLKIHFTSPDSYQTIENIAQAQINNACTGALIGKPLTFKYGNCTIFGKDIEKLGVPLTTREDWDDICAILENYWSVDSAGNFRLDIYRDYLSYRNKTISEASFADSKRSELWALMKRASDGRRYVPRTSLMRFVSPSNIREIIIQDSRLDLEPEVKESFIKIVQSKAPYLLAMCVFAGLRMTSLKKLLDNGLSDASLPLEDHHYCHRKRAADFGTLLERQGGFLAARFENIG